jgi:hypothetical protein
VVAAPVAPGRGGDVTEAARSVGHLVQASHGAVSSVATWQRCTICSRCWGHRHGCDSGNWVQHWVSGWPTLAARMEADTDDSSCDSSGTVSDRENFNPHWLHTHQQKRLG